MSTSHGQAGYGHKHHDRGHGHHSGKFVFGTRDDDVLDGTDRNEIFFGFGGDDTLHAGRGNDKAFGGQGDDLLFGEDGHDRLFGQSGNDGLAGGHGRDHLSGGHGRDFTVSGEGDDLLEGGGGSDKFVIRVSTGKDTVTDFQDKDRIDLRDFGFTSAQDVIDAFDQRGRDAVLDLGGGDKLILKHTRVSDLETGQFIVSDAATGRSSSQSLYVVPVDDSVSTVALLTVGDQVGFKSDGVTPWRMAGIPDGLGAFDNGAGTFTLLMNHEIGAADGVVREHGFAGSFVSKLVIDKTTLAVLEGSDLIQNAFQYDRPAPATRPARPPTAS